MIEIDILPASSEKKGGDSILMRIFNSRTQKVILIDGGYKENAARIKNHLQEYYNTNTIDIAIITHPDQDHISGFNALLDDNTVIVNTTYIHDPWNHTDHMFTRTEDKRRTKKSLGNAFDETLSILLDTLNKSDAKNVEPLAPHTVKGTNLHIIGPTRDFYRNTLFKFPGMEGAESSGPSNIYDEELTTYNDSIDHFLDNPKTSPKNNSSVITLLHDDEGTPVALFTGDAGVDAINQALDTAERQKLSYKGVFLFQIPHHGSIKNISKELIDRISPKNTYISAPPNKIEHPSSLLINYLVNRGIPVYHIKDKHGIAFPYKTVINRPGWGSAPTANRFEKVYRLKKIKYLFFR